MLISPFERNVFTAKFCLVDALDPEMLKKYDISMTNYVPYQTRIEKDRPWYPSMVAARRNDFRENHLPFPVLYKRR